MCSFRTLFVFTLKVVVPPKSKLPALAIWSPEHCAPVQMADATNAVDEFTSLHVVWSKCGAPAPAPAVPDPRGTHSQVPTTPVPTPSGLVPARTSYAPSTSA